MIELEVTFRDGNSTQRLHRELTIDDLNRIMLDRSPFKIMLSAYINPMLDEYDTDIDEYDWKLVEVSENGIGIMDSKNATPKA